MRRVGPEEIGVMRRHTKSLRIDHRASTRTSLAPICTTSTDQADISSPCPEFPSESSRPPSESHPESTCAQFLMFPHRLYPSPFVAQVAFRPPTILRILSCPGLCLNYFTLFPHDSRINHFPLLTLPVPTFRSSPESRPKAPIPIVIKEYPPSCNYSPVW